MKVSDLIRSFRVHTPRNVTVGMLLAAATLIVTACDSPVEPGRVATITVTPASPLVVVNGQQQYLAVARDADDNIIVINPTWQVVAGGGAINSNGVLTAGTVSGTFAGTVRATSGTISGTATAIVLPGALASIVVTPAPAALTILGTQQFTAVGRDSYNNVVTIAPVWSVFASGGTISSTGLFTAGTVIGTFTNTARATSGAISGSATVTISVGALATVTVTPSPATLDLSATQQFTATGRDAGNNVVTITPVWSVVASGGTINAAGLFTAGTVAGTFTNTARATSGGISGFATVTVNAGALATIAVTPNPAVLNVSEDQQFTAVGRDASNNVVTITPVWSVVASGGTINATGLFTAGTVAGTFTNTARATSGGISGLATVTVNAGALATIAVTPNSVVLDMSDEQQFTAVGRDASNNLVTITPVWSVVASGGTINATGLFTAGLVSGIFTNTVRATSGATFGSATVTVPAPVSTLAAVNLGSAENYVILAKSAISNAPTSAITGDLGISPAAASLITGFALTLPAASPFSTSAQVTGNVYAADYAAPTPSNLTTAISDMETAYTDAAGRVNPDFNELATGNIGGLTLAPGLYTWTNSVTIPSDVTLNGSATDVWIFQIAGGMTQSSATNVTLSGGALAKNVFWQVAGAVSIGTTAHIEGIILSATSITLGTGASANGRLMAQTAVNLSGNAVVQPVP